MLGALLRAASPSAQRLSGALDRGQLPGRQMRRCLAVERLNGGCTVFVPFVASRLWPCDDWAF